MIEHGTPSASSTSIHSPLLRVAMISSIIAHSTARFSTRVALVVKRGSFTHSGWPSTLASLTKSRSLPAATMTGPVFVSNALERHDAVAAGAVTLGHRAGGPEARVVPLSQAKPVSKSGVSSAPATGHHAADQRAQHRHHRPHAGAVVEDRGADARGRASSPFIIIEAACAIGSWPGLELQRASAADAQTEQ